MTSSRPFNSTGAMQKRVERVVKKFRGMAIGAEKQAKREELDVKRRALVERMRNKTKP